MISFINNRLQKVLSNQPSVEETGNQQRVAALLDQILENTSGLSLKFIDLARHELKILTEGDLTIRFPGEVLAHIFSFIPKDNRTLCFVSKRYRDIAEETYLREGYFQKRLEQLRTLFKNAGLEGERLDAHVRLIQIRIEMSGKKASFENIFKRLIKSTL